MLCSLGYLLEYIFGCGASKELLDRCFGLGLFNFTTEWSERVQIWPFSCSYVAYKGYSAHPEVVVLSVLLFGCALADFGYEMF